MSTPVTLTPDELDFTAEMMNVGTCHAGSALTKLLDVDVEVAVPELSVLSVDEAVKILGRDSEIVSCVDMRAVGDVDADVFVTLPKRHLDVLKALARSAHPQGSRMPSDMASSVLMETANILTGAYFAAIADFCGLRVFHSVPALATDRLNVLLDESIASLSYKNQECLVIENELAAGGGATTVLTVLLIIEGASFARLVSPAREARERMTK